jgi:hypothetical protein
VGIEHRLGFEHEQPFDRVEGHLEVEIRRWRRRPLPGIREARSGGVGAEKHPTPVVVHAKLVGCMARGIHDFERPVADIEGLAAVDDETPPAVTRGHALTSTTNILRLCVHETDQHIQALCSRDRPTYSGSWATKETHVPTI